MKEEWRTVPWNAAYEVSSEGRVRAIGSSRCLRPKAHGRGYVGVALYGAAFCRTTIHRLVATTFLGTPKVGQEVNHKNGDKLDNRVENLEWTDRASNMRHAYRTGLRSRMTPRQAAGCRVFKLSDADVRSIRARAESKEKHREIAKAFGVSHGLVGQIARKRAYSWVSCREERT